MAGSARTGVLVMDLVDLNVCDSNSESDVTGTVALVQLWDLGSVMEGPGLALMLHLLHSCRYRCWVGPTLDATWTCMRLCGCLLYDLSGWMGVQALLVREHPRAIPV